MDERVGVSGHLLHENIEVVALAGEGLREVFYAFGIGAYAFTDAEQVGRGNVDVTSLGACHGVPCGGVEHLRLEEMAENGIVDECLALTHLETHRVDEHTVVDGRGGVACEEEVVEGLQQVAVVGEPVPLLLLIALDEDACQGLAVEFHQVFGQSVVHLLLLRGAPVVAQTLGNQILTDVVVVEQLFKDVAHVIDIAPTLQHPAEEVVLLVDSRTVEDVAVECLGGVEGRHALYLNAGPSEQYRPQAACLRAHIDIAWVYVGAHFMYEYR